MHPGMRATHPALNGRQPGLMRLNAPQFRARSAEVEGLSTELRTRLQSHAPQRDVGFFVQPESTQLNKIPQDPKNPLTPAKVKLGQLLYHDTGLGVKSESPAGMGSYSCASCHHAAGGFQANLRQGLGDGGLGFGRQGEGRFPNPQMPAEKIDFQPIRTPAAINTAWQKNMLWNGQFGANGANQGTEALWSRENQGTLFEGLEGNHLGFDGVETQAIVGQGAHRLSLRDVIQSESYQRLYAEAYPELPPAKRINQINTGLAIAAFERTMMSNQSPFQRWLKGDVNAMNTAQLRGGLVFFGKAGCVSCHTGPALNSMRFEAIGLKDLTGPDVLGSNPDAEQHLGRGGFTKQPEDFYKFKVPQLYNLADSPFLGHGGSIRSLEDFVSYMNAGVPENARVPAQQLAPQFKPLGLSDAEQRDLVAFLKTALRDPNLGRYQPESVPLSSCIPNADEVSRRDLNCN